MSPPLKTDANKSCIDNIKNVCNHTDQNHVAVYAYPQRNARHMTSHPYLCHLFVGMTALFVAIRQNDLVMP